MKKVSDLGEFNLIRLLKQKSFCDTSVVQGIGDDTAVLPFTSHAFQLVTKDFVVENSHFTFKKDSPEEIGYKVLARNISDIAAMGGKPTYALVGLALPENISVESILGIYKGLNQLAKRFSISIVGGDTTKSDQLIISMTLLGEVPKKKVIYRSGLKKDQFIYVTGSFGGSIYGKHKSFMPRLREAQFLVENFRIHAMIDTSDGLFQDLEHLTRASVMGIDVFTESIPISSMVRKKLPKIKWLQAALSDGEDYELAFAIHKSQAKKLEHAWKKAFPKVLLTCIGETNTSKKIQLLDKQKKMLQVTNSFEGFKHF